MRSTLRVGLFGVFLLLLTGTASRAQTLPGFPHYADFRTYLDSLTAIPDATVRTAAIDSFWTALRHHRKIPYTTRDTVAFLYRGSASSVHWNGDFNAWGNAGSIPNRGTRLGQSRVWILEQVFPSDARIDYKIVLNGQQWILDPDNPYVQWSGFGPNSELRMPDWVYPVETIRRSDVLPGTYAGPYLISSTALHRNVRYWVYLPAGYDSLARLPVIYVTDGHEYADDRLGSMRIVLDNLIHDRKIRPLIAVFIDPRDPASGHNRRMQEYNMNPDFLTFVTDELVPHIDSTYRTDTAPEQRGILGTSMGGLNAAYFGIERPDVFRRAAIQSPAFHVNPTIFSRYRNTPRQPLEIYMSTGTIFDTQDAARQMKTILEEKGYPLTYREVHEGHSWGNWRALIDEILLTFWPASTTTGARMERPTFPHLTVFPNPSRGAFSLRWQLPEPPLHVRLFDLLGREVGRLALPENPQGEARCTLASLPSGTYLLRLETPNNRFERWHTLIR